jgi:hypothetical protein
LRAEIFSQRHDAPVVVLVILSDVAPEPDGLPCHAYNLSGFPASGSTWKANTGLSSVPLRHKEPANSDMSAPRLSEKTSSSLLFRPLFRL